MSTPSSRQERALAILAPLLPDDAYLAGGVAIAMRLQHRISNDLDVFTVGSDPETVVEALADRDDVRITSQQQGTVYLELGGVPVSIIRHRYPLIATVERLEKSTVPLASLQDLTAMKLQAIATRGAARDFWDLHALLDARAISLSDALDDFARRYPTDDLGHVVRSLAYFGDAEAAPLPRGLEHEQWRAICEDFETWTRAL